MGKLEGSVPCLFECAKQVSSIAHETGYFGFIFSKTDFNFTINSRKLKHWKHLTHFVTEKTGAVHSSETAESAISQTSNTAICFLLDILSYLLLSKSLVMSHIYFVSFLITLLSSL